MIDIQKLNALVKNQDSYNWGTHMPCVFYTKSNEPNLIFCKKINGIWKLHYYNNKKIYQINTGLAANVYECNPNIYYNTERSFYILSWTIQLPDNTRIIKQSIITNLKQLYGKTSLISQDIQFAEFGLINANYSAFSYSQLGRQIFVKKTNKEFSLKINLNFYVLARINSIYANDNKFIISVYHPNLSKNSGRTFIIDIITEQIHELKLKNNIYPYKAAIDLFTGYVYYTKCKSTEFEDRQLDVTSDWQLIPVTENIFTFEK